MPARYLNRYILFLFLLGIFGNYYQHNKRLRNQLKLKLIDLVDNEKLQQALVAEMVGINDSTYYRGQQLNYPDTLRKLFNPGNSRIWLERLLVDDLIKNICRDWMNIVQQNGLDSQYYHSGRLKYIFAELQSPKPIVDRKDINYSELAVMMILSADAVMGMYHDLNSGRVEPGFGGTPAALPPKELIKLDQLIFDSDLPEIMKRSVPDFEPYNAIRKEYARLNAFSGKIEFDSLRPLPPPFDSLPPAYWLRNLAYRLKIFGYFTVADSSIMKIREMSVPLERALLQFKAAHRIKSGLKIDKRTAAALNVSVDGMKNTLKANMERWRWIGPVKDTLRIWVNVAENRLYAYNLDTLKLEMKVCTGEARTKAWWTRMEAARKPGSKTARPDNRETPLIKSRAGYYTINPVWHVPHGILTKEMLPSIRANPAILESRGYVLKNQKGEIVNPWSVDWSRVKPSNMKYRLEQLGGDGNALGKVIVHFPNPFSIYCHDTPAKSVFELEDRHVSHGCIRLEKPFKLIEYMCSFNRKDEFDKTLIAAGLAPEHDTTLRRKYLEAQRDTTKTAMDKFKMQINKVYKIEKKIPVYIVYFTVNTAHPGGLTVYNDGYNMDSRLIDKMNNKRALNLKSQSGNRCKTETYM